MRKVLFSWTGSVTPRRKIPKIIDSLTKSARLSSIQTEKNPFVWSTNWNTLMKDHPNDDAYFDIQIKDKSYTSGFSRVQSNIYRHSNERPKY